MTNNIKKTVLMMALSSLAIIELALVEITRHLAHFLLQCRTCINQLA